jgi:type I restriction enzyme M protein
VPLDEIGNADNDWNLNIRRYVDNSPPPEPHDVRAHLQGGVPTVEIEARRDMFEALGFKATHAFVPRANDAVYMDFAPTLSDRAAIRALVESDPGVLAKAEELGEALTTWWTSATPRLITLPKDRQLNPVRRRLLESFVEALAPLGTLDRFKLAGIVATWWAETLPDLKTLLENGFGGVIDGWVDAIADAVEDDDAVGPTFDPFGHKLVHRLMADYLLQIERSRTEIVRLKGDKEAFEASNEPEGFDEEEQGVWDYPKAIEREAKELKAEHRVALKELKKLETLASKARAAEDTKMLAARARGLLGSVLHQLAMFESTLAPYEQIKSDLAAARARYRDLTNAFVTELRTRCNVLDGDQQRALVLDLFEIDLQDGLDREASEKRAALIRYCESLWEKYWVTLESFRSDRESREKTLGQILRKLQYV